MTHFNDSRVNHDMIVVFPQAIDVSKPLDVVPPSILATDGTRLPN